MNMLSLETKWTRRRALILLVVSASLMRASRATTLAGPAKVNDRFDRIIRTRLKNQATGRMVVVQQRLAAARKPIWVRFVLVPGWTDDMAEVERIASFAASLGNVERVDVLPFHQLGRFKWERLGMDYQLKDAHPPSPTTTNAAIALFRAAGLKAY
jgi:pyruvate-formate lyase-activating enzyme